MTMRTAIERLLDRQTIETSGYPTDESAVETAEFDGKELSRKLVEKAKSVLMGDDDDFEMFELEEGVEDGMIEARVVSGRESTIDFREELADSLDREREAREENAKLKRQLEAARALAEHRQSERELSFLQRVWRTLTLRSAAVPVLPQITVTGREKLSEKQAADLATALDAFDVPHVWLPWGVEVIYHDKQGNEFVLQRGSGVIE